MLGDHGEGHVGRCAASMSRSAAVRVTSIGFSTTRCFRPGRADANFGVQAARHADAHHVDVRPGEQRVQVGFGRAPRAVAKAARPGGTVGDRPPAGAGQVAIASACMAAITPAPNGAETAGQGLQPLGEQLQVLGECYLGLLTGVPGLFPPTHQCELVAANSLEYVPALAPCPC